ALIAGGGFRAVSGTCRVCLMPLAAVLTATVGLGLAGADLSAFPLPLLGGEPLRAAEGALGLAVSPFGELAAVFFVLPPPEKTRRGRDVWIASAEPFGILAAVYLRNVLVLGGPGMETLLFRSFYALRIMDLNAFLHRTEIVLSVFYLCCDLLKLSVCLLAVEKAAGRVFGLDRPVCCGGAALVALGASQTLFRNTQALVDFQTAAKLPLAAAWGGLGLVLAAAAAVRRQKRKREKKFSLKSGAQRNII
ncbi:MAG: hypothetical protein IJL69_04380, partial [Oscillospiraceae bacterium]|nr:hypothetical protein [Oscillospiraceae bacterium]